MFLLNNSIDFSKNSVILCDDKKILKSLSYSEMINISEMLQNVLCMSINCKNICLGLLMNHNIFIPSIILTLQKLKHAFVFLTPRNVDKTVTQLNCSWMLSLEDIKELSLFGEVNRLTLTGESLILWKRLDFISRNVNFQNIFCIVETSGSTGENKLIRVTNTCIDTNVSSLRNIFHVKSEDVIYWGTKLTFDPSIIELALALQSGACLLIVPYRVSINPIALYKALFDVAFVTFLQMVPSVFLRWNEDQIKQILLNQQLKILAFGGEHFPKSILAYERGNNLRMFNLYGISEVSCWATTHEITDEGVNDEIPIGKSLEATVIKLCDEFGTVSSSGKGEIFIGSSSRICYINDESPTEISGTVFRGTGDIAEVKENRIFLVGRKNKIIKRFGHRINLTKMEKKIFEETGFENRCVWSQQNMKILTFVIMKNLEIDIKGKVLDKLSIKLINILPKESFPDFIEIVTYFPLTSHGKVNERALEELYHTVKAPLNCVDTFRLLWCKYVGITNDDLHELKHNTFFEMGGNSISALQLLTEFRDMVRCEYPQQLVTMIFESNYKDCVCCLENFRPLKKKRGETSGTTLKGCDTKKIKIGEDNMEVLWSYDLKACVDSSPVVFEKEKVIYAAVGSFSHKFGVFREDGQVVYEITLPDAIECAPSISPCHNFVLVGCSNGTMYCMDFLKQNIVWEFATGSKIKNSVCFCKIQSSAVFGSYDKQIYCVSVMDGMKLWNTLLDGSISSNPIYSERMKRVFSATTKGICFCLREDDGQLVWKKRCDGPIFGTPCVVHTNVSIIFPTVQGVLHCLLMENGELLWKYQVGGHLYSSLVLHKNKVLLGCHDKSVNVLNVSASGCSLVKKILLDSETSTTPFVYDMNGDDVIVTACNSGTISVVSFNSFEVLSSIRLPGEVFSSPVVYDDKIYVGCRDNNFYCMGLNKR